MLGFRRLAKEKPALTPRAGFSPAAEIKLNARRRGSAYSVPMTTNDLQETSQVERAERQAAVVRALKPLLPTEALIWNAEETTPYECDGLTAYRQRPLVVALPETEAQVQAVLRACHAL
ncbi:MAG TPA: hypothetical protein VNS31_05295, partial [Ramlibacter sp.]|nr:hypothetical protein [Ramlibacter sp.]